MKNQPDIDTSPEGLVLLRARWWPEGSGPLNAMRYIVALIDIIAELKGYNLDETEFVDFEGRRYKGSFKNPIG